MIRVSVARKYAWALLKIGQQEANFESLGNDLEKVVSLVKQNKELKGVLFSSAFPVAVRKRIMNEISIRLGLSKWVANFLNLLLARERIDHLFEISQAYRNLCDAVANRLRASLVSAVALPPELFRKIQEQLEFLTGKEVLLSIDIDPSLLGGVLTKIDNVIYDGSLKTQLFKLKENLYVE